MDTYMNIKNSLMLLGSGAFLFLFSALTSGIIWLTVVLMIVGIAGIAIGGAYFIRNTWMDNDAKRDKRQWGRFDFVELP